jgi:signal peptidase I
MHERREGEAGWDGPRPAEAWLRGLRRLAVGVALLLSLVQQAFLVSYRVAGSSMMPAFVDGDRVLVARTPGFFGQPRPGETIIARVHGEVVIKRVAAAPGDTISLTHGVLHRNGALVDDAAPAAFHDACDFEPVKLAADEYFLLGDHRRVSIDSREFGPIRRDAILGRVILRVPQQGAGCLTGALARH